ncbi:MAG: hypothetical protein AAGK28_09340 [Pseudomonadota bacterium]
MTDYRTPFIALGSLKGRMNSNEAVDLVFSTLDGLEQVLDDQAVLFGNDLTRADIWLFCYTCEV